MNLFNQTRKDNENIHRDVGGYDMSYDEFKDLCRKSWEDDYKYIFVLIDLRREIDEDTVFVVKAELHI